MLTQLSTKQPSPLLPIASVTAGIKRLNSAKVFSDNCNPNGKAKNLCSLSTHFRLQVICDEKLTAKGYEYLLNPTEMLDLADKNLEEYFDKLGYYRSRLLFIRQLTHLYYHREEVVGLVFINLEKFLLLDSTVTEFIRMFSGFMKTCSIDVVFEVTERYHAIEGLIGEVIENLRADGIKMAADDYQPALKADFKVQYDIYKIEISELRQHSPDKQQEINSHIRQLRNSGAKILIEKIENHDDLELAIRLNADYFQGFFFLDTYI